MKNLLLSITLGLLTFLFFYLAGAFTNASFNISKWGEGSLIFVPIFGLMAFFITVALSMAYFQQKDEKK